MKRTHHLYLVPGFLGFAHLGRITYFGHVARTLTERLTALGLEPHVHVVRTSPTASLPARAAQVAEVIDATARRGGAPLHLIGHPSGGLDVRLLTAPGVGLPTTIDVDRFAACVRTVVTISTPHHGTPLASLFTTLRGQQLLQLLSLNTVYVLNFGNLPLAAALWMGSLLVRFGGLVANSSLLDELFGRLLEDFSPKRRRAVRDLLTDVVSDQALMLQLTHALFRALYHLIASSPGRACPSPAPAVARALRQAYGELPSVAASDGVVPTLSQAWGHVIHAAVADHLDVLGHFRDASCRPPHVDWLVSGSGFDRDRFDALWSDVTRFLVEGAQRRPKRRRSASS